jgi:hypothetical protein
MQFDQAPNQSEPDAEAPLTPVERALALDEELEDMGQ